MIRKMKPDDIDRLMQLWLQGNLDAHTFISKKYWLSHYAEVRLQLPQADVSVYEESGSIQGFAGMTEHCLAGIFVEKSFRGRGIGHMLLEHIKQHTSTFTLNVYQENHEAVEFYLREGLSITAGKTDPDTKKQEWIMNWNKRAKTQSDRSRLYAGARNR